MTDPRNEPRTEAGRALLEQLESVGRAPYSGVSFLSAEDDIAAIEQEARRQALVEAAQRVGALSVPSVLRTQYGDGWESALETVLRSAILSETEG